MKDFKGTKGKWILETIKDNDGEISEIYISQEGGGCIICVNDGDDNYDIEGDLANAKLIASAPDLLEALQEIQSMCYKDGQRTGHLYEICEQAINKALS